MMLGYGIGNFLKEDSLTCLGLGHNQSTLSFPDGTEHINNPYRERTFSRLAESEFLIREERGEEVKRNTVSYEIGTSSVYFFNFYKREIFLTLFRGPDTTLNGITGLKTKKFYLRLGYINVVG